MEIDQIRDKIFLENKIKELDEQITSLTELKQKYLSELQEFTSVASSDNNIHKKSNFTPDEKIALFKSYFKGRDDVYSRFWLNEKTGKKGYSPHCKHEWVKGICRKPIVKCSECASQEFKSLDEVAIKNHLTGSFIVGIYPMLKNESCYFLAMDFDKENWFEDITALRKTCESENIPVGIERSRSGKGGHAWIFFNEEIPAITARKLGSYLITKTMSNRFQMDMKSYDRLFPNQDTMPKGGFGNLIALPFQKEAVLNGNTLFIDEQGIPYKDQWGFLSSLKKMFFVDVQNIVDIASNQGKIIDVRFSPIDEQDEPWMRLPSGKKRFKIEIKDLPDSIDIIFANRIYIKTNTCPSPLLNRLKYLAAFQNPEFYKRQKMRFSTHATPRVISCAEIDNVYLSLPRGCMDDIKILLEEYNIKLNIDDKRISGEKIKCKFLGKLTPEQEKALKDVIASDVGVLVAPPGSGKTVLGIAAIAKRKKNVLILVHRKPLMDQWKLQLSILLGIDKKDIGQIGCGRDKSNGKIDIAMVQSMENKEGVDDRIAQYGFIIIDECHHVSAFSFEKVLQEAKAKYVLGLTATPFRRDGHQPIIHMQCGPICHKIKNMDITKSSVITRKTDFVYDWKDESKIHELFAALIDDKERNHLIVQDVLDALDEGRYPLILTEHRKHLELLEELLKEKVNVLMCLHGGITQKIRREIFSELKENKERKVILATGSYIGEGFDEPRLDTLFLTMPSSFKGKIVQYAGRLHRQHEDKKDVKIYDYVDEKVSVLSKMYQKRLKTYKIMNYEIS